MIIKRNELLDQRKERDEIARPKSKLIRKKKKRRNRKDGLKGEEDPC